MSDAKRDVAMEDERKAMITMEMVIAREIMSYSCVRIDGENEQEWCERFASIICQGTEILRTKIEALEARIALLNAEREAWANYRHNLLTVAAWSAPGYMVRLRGIAEAATKAVEGGKA